jgi:ribosomal protein S27AE
MTDNSKKCPKCSEAMRELPVICVLPTKPASHTEATAIPELKTRVYECGKCHYLELYAR